MLNLETRLPETLLQEVPLGQSDTLCEYGSFQGATRCKRKLMNMVLGSEKRSQMFVAINMHAHACKQVDSGLRGLTQRAACGGARLVIRSSLW